MLALLLAACSGGSSPSPAPAPTATSLATASATATASPRASASPPPSPTASPAPSATAPGLGTASEPTVGGCPVFPSDNAWNTDISAYPVDPNSANYLASMHASTTNLHPDFGSNPQYGIPYVVVPGSQPLVPIAFTAYASESDPGPYPIPSNAPIEGGAGSTGDRHVIVVDAGTCTLYELYAASYSGPGWNAASGAMFHLDSDALRPDGWTSADAAGLPILAGLVRFDETTAGAIHHAIRMTTAATQAGYIHPATHHTGSNTDPNLPPMGLRLRLKSSYDISGFNPTAQTILTAMKRYGLIVADNGSDFFFTGASDTRWNDDDLNALKAVPASAFEVVHTGTIQQ